MMIKKVNDMNELEKENAELKSELTKKVDTNHSLVEQMADLESENAELKENWRIDHNTLTEYNVRLIDQLIKAKEIINKIIELVEFLNEDNVKEPIIEQAEQFLKEIDK